MAQGTAQDRRAAAVNAARGRFAGFAHQTGSAGWTGLGELHRLGKRRSELRQHPHHFRDDLSGLAHHNGVAVVEIELHQPVGVVEAGPADARAG